jgi:hypothetical protein
MFGSILRTCAARSRSDSRSQRRLERPMQIGSLANALGGLRRIVRRHPRAEGPRRRGSKIVANPSRDRFCGKIRGANRRRTLQTFVALESSSKSRSERVAAISFSIRTMMIAASSNSPRARDARRCDFDNALCCNVFFVVGTRACERPHVASTSCGGTARARVAAVATCRPHKQTAIARAKYPQIFCMF